MSSSVIVDDLVVQRVRAAAGSGVPSGPELAEVVRQLDPLLGASAVGDVVARVLARVTGLGPLERLLADPAVSDILVNGPGPVWVERAGVIERTDVVLDRAAIDLFVERIVAPLGRRVDPASPVVDARLADGSRVHVVVPPLAVDGPYLTIRRFAARRIDLVDAASPEVARLLAWAVRARANVLVVGGTGSGKTTLLNALASVIAPSDRIVTVEDAAELRLPSDHVVRLETRPASVEGVAAVDCRELVRNALRMRPDRLVIGEVRGPEALDLVQAMNTGHDGSLSTLHANSCEDAMRRLETLVLLAGVGLPLDAVREHLAAAVDLVVHIARGEGGGRRVVEVAEVRPPGSRPHPAAGGSDGPDLRATRSIADAHVVHARPCRSQRWAAAGPFPMAVAPAAPPAGAGAITAASASVAP